MHQAVCLSQWLQHHTGRAATTITPEASVQCLSTRCDTQRLVQESDRTRHIFFTLQNETPSHITQYMLCHFCYCTPQLLVMISMYLSQQLHAVIIHSNNQSCFEHAKHLQLSHHVRDPVISLYWTCMWVMINTCLSADTKRDIFKARLLLSLLIADGVPVRLKWCCICLQCDSLSWVRFVGVLGYWYFSSPDCIDKTPKTNNSKTQFLLFQKRWHVQACLCKSLQRSSLNNNPFLRIVMGFKGKHAQAPAFQENSEYPVKQCHLFTHSDCHSAGLSCCDPWGNLPI